MINVDMFQDEKKERHAANGGWRGNQYEKVAAVATLPHAPAEPKARDKAGADFSTGSRYIQDAKRIKQGAPFCLGDT